MLALERIPDQTGYLVLTEDGAVLTVRDCLQWYLSICNNKWNILYLLLQSGGDLENDERIANIISSLVTLTSKVDPKAFPLNNAFEKISINYKDHCYVVCLSNKKIYVVKRNLPSPTTANMESQSTIEMWIKVIHTKQINLFCKL